MGLAIDPTEPIGEEMARVARHRLDKAVQALDELDAGDAASIEEAVHTIRKRCKEVRAIARLVRPGLDGGYEPFNAAVRDAARELSSIRDAHAMLGTFDDLRDAAEDHPHLRRARVTFQADADVASAGVRSDDPRLDRARQLLGEARTQIDEWDLPGGFAAVEAGLRRAYRNGRRRLERARTEPTDVHVHEWRKSVKDLWYHLRLLEASAPSVLSPLIERFDELAEACGDDHDLAVIVERLDAAPERFGGEAVVAHARDTARQRQAELRAVAFRLGATLYAERPKRFVARLRSYVATTRSRGPEPEITTTDAAADSTADAGAGAAPAASGDGFERERTYLVATTPELATAGVEIRQGYLMVTEHASLRVRDAGGEGCTLTVKAGQGSVRTELEWPISSAEFERLWAQTDGSRIHKTRHRLPYGDHVVELDVFHGALEGLVLAEVEFHSDDEMAGFLPPDWFGDEVTDDKAYTNAQLSTADAPPGR